MNPTVKKVIDIIHDLLRIGKTTAKQIQIDGDVATAKRIKKAIFENDTPKLRKIVMRGGILMDKKDITGIYKSATDFGVLVSVDFIVNYRQMFKIIRRYKRKGD